MNRQLRKLQVTAADIGHCLVCGGVNGNCTCVASLGSPSRDHKERSFYDLRNDVESRKLAGNKGVCSSRNFYCKHCFSVLLVDLCSCLVRCECGSILKHIYIKPVISDPDYSVFDGLSGLPKRALRKPKI